MWNLCKAKASACFEEPEVHVSPRHFQVKEKKSICGHPNPPFPQTKTNKNIQIKSSLRVLKLSSNRTDGQNGNQLRSPVNSMKPKDRSEYLLMKNQENKNHLKEPRNTRHQKDWQNDKQTQLLQKKSLSNLYSTLRRPHKSPLNRQKNLNSPTNQSTHKSFRTPTVVKKQEKQKNGENIDNSIPWASQISSIFMKSQTQIFENKFDTMIQTNFLNQISNPDRLRCQQHHNGKAFQKKNDRNLLHEGERKYTQEFQMKPANF